MNGGVISRDGKAGAGRGRESVKQVFRGKSRVTFF